MGVLLYVRERGCVQKCRIFKDRNALKRMNFEVIFLEILKIVENFVVKLSWVALEPILR